MISESISWLPGWFAYSRSSEYLELLPPRPAGNPGFIPCRDLHQMMDEVGTDASLSPAMKDTQQLPFRDLHHSGIQFSSLDDLSHQLLDWRTREMSISTFLYTKLDAKRREIRILTVPARNKNQYSMRHISLDDDIRYEALSYVWGSGQQSSKIIVDGKSMLITETLKQALGCLSGDAWENTRFLWIDQICINQASLEERSAQVEMMGKIYAGAFNVVVWLGYQVAETALKDLKTLDKKFRQESISVEDNLDSPHAYESPPEPGKSTSSTNEEEYITIQEMRMMRVNERMLNLELLRLPWFRRVWVLQEVAVARKVTVQIRDWTFPWQSLCQALETLKDTHEIYSTNEGIKKINKLRAGWSHKQVDTDSLDLLERFRHYEASDQRDKVYSLLGLVPVSTAGKNTVRIPSDYSKTARDVYKLVAMQYIKHRSNLDVLSHVILDTSLNSSLPSWAPDWSRYDPGLVSLPKYRQENGESKPVYNCCGTLKLNSELLSESDLSDVLILEGLAFDTVLEVGTFAISAEDLGLGARRTIVRDFRIMKEWKKMSQKGRKLYGSSTESAFWRTLVADVVAEDRIGRDDTEFVALAEYAVQNGFSTTSEEVSSNTKDLHLCVAALKRGSVKRAFFVTQKGYIGLSPASTHVGDKVYVMAGSRVPFILRAAEDVGVYSLVGESYVHGIMDGEAAEGEVDLEMICLV